MVQSNSTITSQGQLAPWRGRPGLASRRHSLDFARDRLAGGREQGQDALATAVLRESGQNVNLCYQCRKCAAGCPISFAMDYKPAQLIHAIRLGMDDLVLNSQTMWLCASCETCTTRCPQEVDVAKVMDAVKITALRRGIKPAIPQVASFYKAALANIKKCGRMYEMGMIIGLKMRTFEFFKDAGLGMKMFKKGKLKMVPSLSGALTTMKIFRRVKRIEKKMNKSD